MNLHLNSEPVGVLFSLGWILFPQFSLKGDMNDRDPSPRVVQRIKLVPMKDNEDDEKEVLPGGWVRMKKEGENKERELLCQRLKHFSSQNFTESKLHRIVKREKRHGVFQNGCIKLGRDGESHVETWGMSDDEIITIWKSIMSPKLRESMHRPSPGLGRIGVPVEPFGIGCFGKLVTEVKSCKKLDADFEFIDYDAIKNAFAGKVFPWQWPT